MVYQCSGSADPCQIVGIIVSYTHDSLQYVVEWHSEKISLINQKYNNIIVLCTEDNKICTVLTVTQWCTHCFAVY